MNAKQLSDAIVSILQSVDPELTMCNVTDCDMEPLDRLAKIAGYDNAKSVTDQQNLWGLTVLEWVLEMAGRVGK